MKPKRLTKEQRREQEIAALEQRIQDIFTGCGGCADFYENGYDMVSELGAQQFGSFITAICNVWHIDMTKPYDETSNPHVAALRHWNYVHMETPRRLAERLHREGVRA